LHVDEAARERETVFEWVLWSFDHQHLERALFYGQHGNVHGDAGLRELFGVVGLEKFLFGLRFEVFHSYLQVAYMQSVEKSTDPHSNFSQIGDGTLSHV
jgi:hypothetical protein